MRDGESDGREKKKAAWNPHEKPPCLDKVSVIGYRSDGAHRHGGFQWSRAWATALEALERSPKEAPTFRETDQDGTGQRNGTWTVSGSGGPTTDFWK